jgi:hypothetical protein
VTLAAERLEDELPSPRRTDAREVVGAGLAPPLVIGEQDVERAVSILTEALAAVQSGARGR